MLRWTYDSVDRGRILRWAFGCALLSLVILLGVGPTLASGANCDHNATCETGNTYEMSIDCGTHSVSAFTCEPVQENAVSTLLRVAVRCYGSTNGKEAQLTSKHGWNGVPFLFNLAQSCSSGYIASAHWIRNLSDGGQEVYQAQCSSRAVPACEALEPGEAEDLGQRFTLYSLVNPASNACGGGPDTSQIEARSASLNRGYEGVLAGNYMCVRDPDATTWGWYDEAGHPGFKDRGQQARIAGFNLGPQGAAEFAVNDPPNFNFCCDHEVASEIGGLSCATNPERCSPLDVQCASAVVFGVCRDAACATYTPLERAVWFGPRADVNPGQSAFLPSAYADTACFRFDIEQAKGDGDLVVVDHVFGEAPPPPPSDPDDTCGPPVTAFLDVDADGIYDSCDPVIGSFGPSDGVQRFLLRANLRNEGILGTFDNNPDGGLDEVKVGGVNATVLPTYNDDVFVPGDDEIWCGENLTADSQKAGIDDVQVIAVGQSCPDSKAAAVSAGPDHVLQTAPATDDLVGVQEIRCGQNRVVDTAAIGDDVQEIGVDDTCVSAFDTIVSAGANGTVATRPSQPNTQEVVVPLSADLADQTIEWRSSAAGGGGSFKAAAQAFTPRWYGYASDGTNGGLLLFDAVGPTTSGPMVVDGNATPYNSYLNLDCGSELDTAGPPKGIATRPVGAAPVDREVFTIADVWTPALEHRLFGFDVQTQRLLPTMPSTGVVLTGSPRALDIAQDKDDIWRAYIARKVDDNTSTVTVVRVDPEGEGGLDPLWRVQDGTVSISGLPLGIRTHYFAGTTTKVYAYVTSVACVPPGGLGPGFRPDFHCREDCGGGTTNYRKTYLSVVDVTNPDAMSLVSSFLIASTASQCSGSEVSALDLQNAGAAFNLEHSKLYIANPDGNRVEVLNTPLNTLAPPILIANAAPVDVAVVEPGGTGAARAYVAGRASQRIHIIVNVSSGTPSLFAESVNLAEDGQQRQPVAIAARSDGLRLFTADSTHGTVSVSNIVPGHQDENHWVQELRTGLNATRLVLLKLP